MSSSVPTKFLILAHVISTVPLDDLILYLQKTTPNLDLEVITHPLVIKSGTRSEHYLYTSRNRLRQHQLIRQPQNLILTYLQDLFQIWKWLCPTKKHWQVAICFNNLLVFAAWVMKKFGLIDQIIYYSIDFTPQRFPSHLLNRIYHQLDKWAVAHSDQTWNVSPQIAVGRTTVEKFPPALTAKQITVPVGIWLDRIPVVPPEQKQRFNFIYAGGLSKHQGLDKFIACLPQILVHHPQVTLTIIGQGPDEQSLKNLVKQLKLNKVVKFLGYFSNHAEVESHLAHAGIGLALYNPEVSTWSHYSDPSKIKTYLAGGLPVITTSVTFFHQIITNNKCGIVVDFTNQAIIAASRKLLDSESTYNRMSKNARLLANDYHWQTIFNQAFDKFYHR